MLRAILHNLVLPLLGISLSHGQRIVGWTLRGRSILPWYLLVLIALCLCTGVYWLYRLSARHVTPRARLTLSTLRTLFLLLLLLLLAHPVLRLDIQGASQSALVVLIDDSASMAIHDNRTDAQDIARAAIAAGALSAHAGIYQPAASIAPGDYAHLSRVELLRQVVQNRQMGILPRLLADYTLLPFTFGSHFSAAGANLSDAINNLAPAQESTALGDAIAQSLAAVHSQPTAGIWLISDGQSNTGLPLQSAAELARQAGVPIFVYATGVTQPRDVAITSVFAPQICFARDPVSVSIQMRQRGYSNSMATLHLTLDGTTVAQSAVALDASGQQIETLKFTPDKTGDYEIKAQVDPLPGEATAQNNQLQQHIRVIDSRIKVLYVERSPRWEYKYLVALLQRDPRVDLKCWLLDADPGVAKVPRSPFITAFPATQAELFSYDLVILGDIPPATLKGDEWQNLDTWVSHFGGGLMTVAGRAFMPMAYRQTPLADMLPIRIGEASPDVAPDSPSFDQPIHVELTDAGLTSPLLALAGTSQANQDIWKSMPPIYFEAPIAGAKEAAEVLMVDADPAKATRDRKLPLIAIEPYGVGQVLYVGTDNTWRWRKNIGDQYYASLWGQLVQRLTLPRLIGQSKRTQLSTDKLDYASGQEITIFARLFDADFQPVHAASVKAIASGPSQQNLSTQLTPTQGGGYRGSFTAGNPGPWTLSVETDPLTKVAFTVSRPMLETSETAMNEIGLRNLADMTGGAFFREENLVDLPDAINSKAQQFNSTIESEVCFTGAYFAVLMFVLSIEWILRKRQHLK